MEKKIKKTYICKDVNHYELQTNLPENHQLRAGDVAVFEIIKNGKHKSIQLETKRNSTIVPGDWIMAAFGTRYATAQFEGYLPEHLDQELHILGAGGTVGIIKSMHRNYLLTGPTTLKLIGFAVDNNGTVINTKSLKSHQMKKFSGAAAAATKVILSLGSSMDSGKTTSAAYLVHGLKKSGYRVAFIKLTGTVYTKDADLAYDLGADKSIDFGEFGFPSTYMCSEEELLNLYESLLSQVLPIQPDFVVMEIADGLYERETKMLLNNFRFRETVEAVIFSAGDSLSAINGIQTLNTWNIFPIGLSGLFTTSPLLIKEVMENSTVPVYTIGDLSSEGIASQLLGNQIAMNRY